MINEKGLKKCNHHYDCYDSEPNIMGGRKMATGQLAVMSIAVDNSQPNIFLNFPFFSEVFLWRIVLVKPIKLWNRTKNFNFF